MKNHLPQERLIYCAAFEGPKGATQIQQNFIKPVINCV